MGTVTIAEAWPQHGEGCTIDDLDRMPDDGHRYELLDGSLIVSPAPGLPHQRVAFVLTHILELANRQAALGNAQRRVGRIAPLPSCPRSASPGGRCRHAG